MASTQRIVMDKRRQAVERMALHGLSTREIEAAFAEELAADPNRAAEQGMVNPDTGEAWDHTTISRDLTYLEKQWQDETLEERMKHKARQLVELRAHRRSAWEAGELSEIRLNIKTEMELLGTAAATKIEHTGADGGPIRIYLPDNQRERKEE